MSENESEETQSPSSIPSEGGEPEPFEEPEQQPDEVPDDDVPDDVPDETPDTEPEQVKVGPGPDPVDENTANVDWSLPVDEGAPEGLILEPDEEERFEGEEIGNMVIIKRDVYRKVMPRSALKPSYVLLYRAGTQVPKTSSQLVGSIQSVRP